jgi:hypothetical protein
LINHFNLEVFIMGVMSSTNFQIFVSAASPATRDSVGYAALTYTKVSEIVSISGFGVSVDPIEVRTLDSGALRTYKGHYNYGGVQGDMNYDPDDAGQNILRANILSNDELSVKLVDKDGNVTYSGGPSMAGQRTPGSANNMVTASFDVRFNYPPVEVAA